MNNAIIKEEYSTNLMDIMSIAQNIADMPGISIQNTYLVFAGGTIRAINKKTGIFVHGYDNYRKVADALTMSNTALAITRILSFAAFVDQYNVGGIKASYVKLVNGHQLIRVQFMYSGMCDYTWDLTPIGELGVEYGR